jgi:hypothetical protein
MGLFTSLLTLPVAPVRGVMWVTEQVADEAMRQLYDEDRIRGELLQLELDAEEGKLSEEEQQHMEEELFARLATAQAEQRGNRRRSDNGRLSAVEAVTAVRREFPALLGRAVESVLGVERDDDDGWLVTVQVVELERIPRSTDVLGAYAVQLDKDGELIGYRRRRRYNRSQADED